ncbi:helix-turn-helix domain-containing protein [Yinghuangia sp. YIM S09857]|uniref:helix-turn-helix domain-containing protein n=1 Tax=Yinghuangia sp. YIM S09857 TaxID=3436929 RepID=UPI003F5292EF
MAETVPLFPSTAEPTTVEPGIADRFTADRAAVDRPGPDGPGVVRPVVDRPGADRRDGDETAPGRSAPRRAGAPEGEPLWRHVLGDRFRALRHERGETLVETAGRAGVSPQYLSEVERGIKEPSSEMIAALAGALDVTLVDLTLAVSERLRSAAPAVRASAVRRAPTCQAAYALAV